MSSNWRDLSPVSEDEAPNLPENWTPSQTFLRTMDSCDRAALLYLTYGAGAGSHELNRGSLMHETIERLERLLIEQQENTIPPEMGRDILYEVMRENPRLQVSAFQRDELRYLIDHFCRGTYFEPERIIGIEKTLSLETGGFRVQVRPDLIEDMGGGVCRIRDYKSAWPPDSEDFRAQAYDSQGNPRWAGNYQLNMAAVVAAFGITDDGLPLGNFSRFILDLEYPRILRSDGIDQRRVEVDRLQLQSFKDDLDEQLNRLQTICLDKRKWQATPGNHCRECPAEVACPLPRVLRPESQLANLQSVSDLEEAAATWHFGSARMQRLKARLKKAAESLPDSDLDLGDGLRGVRIGDGLALIFVETESEKILDKENMFAAAEEAAKGLADFRREDFVKRSKGVSFKKRKIPPK